MAEVPNDGVAGVDENDKEKGPTHPEVLKNDQDGNAPEETSKTTQETSTNENKDEQQAEGKGNAVDGDDATDVQPSIVEDSTMKYADGDESTDVQTGSTEESTKDDANDDDDDDDDSEQAEGQPHSHPEEKEKEETAQGASSTDSKKRKADDDGEAPPVDAEKENVDDKRQSDESEAATHSSEQKTDAPILPRPIKKARSAYLIFSSDKRPGIQAANPGETMGNISKKIGHQWNNMSEEERRAYHVKAAEERERVAKDLEDWKATTGLDELPPVESGAVALSPHATVFPVARIRKIIRLDPEVKGVSKEATALITKCAELAAIKLGKEVVTVARLQNRRKLIATDVAQVCSSREQFLFLREDLKDLAREQLLVTGTNTGAAKKPAETSTPAAASKPLTDYFGAGIAKS